MTNDTSQHLDRSATIELAHVRDVLRQALVQYDSDQTLRRAFLHATGAIDDRLGIVRATPNRKTRRQELR